MLAFDVFNEFEPQNPSEKEHKTDEIISSYLSERNNFENEVFDM